MEDDQEKTKTAMEAKMLEKIVISGKFPRWARKLSSLIMFFSIKVEYLLKVSAKMRKQKRKGRNNVSSTK